MMTQHLSDTTLSDATLQNSNRRMYPRRINDELSDIDLLLALQSGQAEALGLLYDRHARLVYTVALRVLGNSEEAEDLTQEIFLKLRQGTSYDYSRGSLQKFLSVLTRSRAIDRLRVRNNRSQILQRWRTTMVEMPVSQPTDYAVSEELSDVVRNALNQLPVQQRQVLEIAYYEGLSHSQLAARLNIPIGTVKTRSRKGLIRLRGLLQGIVD
jgi:RNA polymerase sigma-70 factor, ECF subfamily